jgi:putative ABC transport system permease protein
MNNRLAWKACPRVFGRPHVIVNRIPRPVLLTLVALALGLGVNTALYFRAYFDFLTPYPHVEQLVVVRLETPGPERGVMSQDFTHWKQQATAFQALNASTDRMVEMKTRDGAIKVVASLVTPGFYRMMGDRFSLGDDFNPQEDARQVILTDSMWKRLGADPAIIGSTVLVNLEPYSVVGVLAPGQRDQGGSVTIPLVFPAGSANQNDLPMNVIGRLAPGVSIREAQAELNTMVAQIPHNLSNRNDVWSVSVEPLRSAARVNDRRLLIWLLVGGAAFLFLLEGTSVVNLLRVRSDAVYQHRFARRSEE